MSRFILLLLLICGTSFVTSTTFAQGDFRAQQKKYRRVRTAYSDKGTKMKELLAEKGITSLNIELYIRAFKAEKELEVWVRSIKTARYIHLISYPFAGYSGILGPKSRQGDGQVPEGFYHIDRFNPVSNFYLSLGLNYPNRVDRKRAGSNDPGGDIFIHGNRVTIGCIPITNDKIKELYLLAVEARSHGQTTIQVHIFPFRFDQNWKTAIPSNYKDNVELISFWETIEPAYRIFEEKKIPSEISITRTGFYQIKTTTD